MTLSLRSLLLLLLCMAGTSNTSNAQQDDSAKSFADLIVASESHSIVEVSVSTEITLNLRKQLQGEPAAPPFTYEEQRRYRVTRGFDNADNPITIVQLLNSSKPTKAGTPRHANLAVMQNDHLRLFGGDGKEMRPPTIPGKLDIAKVEFLNVSSNSRLTRVKDPHEIPLHGNVQLAEIDASTVTITSQPRRHQDRTRVITFQKDVNGLWLLGKRELFANTPQSTFHQSFQSRELQGYTNMQGDLRRLGKQPLRRDLLRAIDEDRQQQLTLRQKLTSFRQRESSHSRLPLTDESPAKSQTKNSGGPSAEEDPLFSVEPILPPQSPSSGANGANIAYVHGFLSDGGTWSVMEPWLASDFNLNLQLSPSIGSGGTERLSSWEPELINALDPLYFPSTQYIGIGHSAGGLVSRAVAQARPDVLYGVITLDTPHQGSLLLTNLEASSVELFLNRLLGDSCQDTGTCSLASILITGALAGVATIGTAEGLPTTVDLLYPNSYTTNLNSVPETFARVGLIGPSDPNWISFRTLADFIPGHTDPSGGNTAAADAGYLDDALNYVGDSFEGIAELYYELWALDNYDYNDGYYDLYEEYDSIAGDFYYTSYILEAFDEFWREAASCTVSRSYCDPLGSDGVVSAGSQEYPGAQNYVMANFDATHTTSTQSQVSRSYLDLALSQQMFTPPIVCTASSSSVSSPGTATFNVPFNGATLTFQVNNPNNCNWSAASSVPWIGFLDQPSGSGATTIRVLVDFNSFPASQSGTVTIAGTTFTINQDAMPVGLPYGEIDFGFGLGVDVPNQYWTITIGSQTYGGTLVDGYYESYGNIDRDAAAAADAINADPNSPVYAGVDGALARYNGSYLIGVLRLVGKTPQTAGTPYAGQVYVSPCTPGSYSCYPSVYAGGITPTLQ